MKKLILFTLLILLINNVFAQNNNLEGRLVSVYYAYPFKDISYCNFYEFKIYKNTNLKNIELQLLRAEYINTSFFNNENSSKNFLRVKSLLSFLWNEEKVVYINYDKINDKGLKESFIYTTNDALQINDDVKHVLKLSNNAFWEFYNSENNPNYPEINKLKPLVKDANGILNIDKLAKVIKENQSGLSKYLEE